MGMYVYRLVFYTDLSNTWKLDRKKRIVTDVGGIYFQLIMVSFLSLMLFFSDLEVIKISIGLIFFSILINLNPVLRYDGYWILTDLFGIINIHQRVFEAIKSLYTNIKNERKFRIDVQVNLSPKMLKALYTYMIIYLLGAVMMVFIGTVLVVQLTLNFEAVADGTVRIIERILASSNIFEFAMSLSSSLIILVPIIYKMLLLSKLFRLYISRKKINA